MTRDEYFTTILLACGPPKDVLKLRTFSPEQREYVTHVRQFIRESPRPPWTSHNTYKVWRSYHGWLLAERHKLTTVVKENGDDS